MPRRRLAVSALLILPAILAAAMVVSASANANTPNITIVSVGPDAAGNPAMPTVVATDANSGQQVTSMTVNLYASGATSPTYQVTDMTLVSTDGSGNETWAPTSPIGSALTPGTYTVTVDATDPVDGTDSGLTPTTGPDTLAFVYTGVSLTSTATAISYNAQSATVSGALTGVPPWGADSAKSPVAIGGEQVELVDHTSSATQPIGMTAASGTTNYTGTATLNPADTYFAQVEADPANGVPTTNAAAFQPTVNANQTALVNIKVSPGNMIYGKTIATMTGTAEYLNTSNKWQGLANSSVQIIVGSAAAVQVATNGSGSFTFTVPTKEGNTWQVMTGSNQPLLQPSSATGSFNVLIPIAIKSFTASLSPFAIISAHGCLVGEPNFTPPGKSSSVQVQYALTTKGPWTKLANVSLRNATSASCAAADESYFSVSARAKLANAYYRAVYFGVKNIYGTSTSAQAHAWKYFTQIVQLKVSPRSVKKGGKITVSGRLQQLVHSWTNFSRQQMLIILKPRGKSSWYWIYKVTTNAQGQFSKKFTDPVSASWSAEYLGNATHLASIGPSFYVSVTGKAKAAGGILHTLSNNPAELAAVLAALGGR